MPTASCAPTCRGRPSRARRWPRRSSTAARRRWRFRPPWSGGFTWAESADGQPWIAVSCQGEGADVWWPVKDHPSDEATDVVIELDVPVALRAISNGRFESRTESGDRATERWRVTESINNYGVSFGIGPLRRSRAGLRRPDRHRHARAVLRAPRAPRRRPSGSCPASWTPSASWSARSALTPSPPTATRCSTRPTSAWSTRA